MSSYTLNNGSILNGIEADTYISDKIIIFELLYCQIVKEINMAGTNWMGKKIDWNTIYEPKLNQFTKDLQNFINSLIINNFIITNINDKLKLNKLIKECNAMNIIGSFYFPK
jgi:hypothetical protein